MKKRNLCIVSIIMFLLLGSLIASTPIGYCENSVTSTETKIDNISIKQREMRDPTIMVQTRRGNGSGTIIDRLPTINDDIYEYRVLTNAHVTHSRFIHLIRGVDSITGKLRTNIVDSGCVVIVVDHETEEWLRYDAEIIDEDTQYDLALLAFFTDKSFAVANIADYDMLDQVRVFDEIFALGCQLSNAPSPTTGIISQIFTGDNGEKQWVIYGNTAQITPGSSGGGLYKQYGDHYYLIGIPFRVAVLSDGQIIPHLSHAISIGTARGFIDQNMVTCHQ